RPVEHRTVIRANPVASPAVLPGCTDQTPSHSKSEAPPASPAVVVPPPAPGNGQFLPRRRVRTGMPLGDRGEGPITRRAERWPEWVVGPPDTRRAWPAPRALRREGRTAIHTVRRPNEVTGPPRSG